jgi:DNA mismatch repair protein MutS
VNVHVAAVESQGRGGREIVFLHEIQPGPASRSYGVQVARLAGVPAAVLRQATAALESLEARQRQGEPQIDLFATPAGPGEADDTESAPGPGARDVARVTIPPTDPLREALDAVDPDRLSPRDALDALYRLKALAAADPDAAPAVPTPQPERPS